MIHCFKFDGIDDKNMNQFLYASFNEETDEETPLTRALRSEKCSLDALKILLDGETDVNSWNEQYGSPLIVALCCFKDEAIIKTLLQKGAKHDVELHDRNCLCYALCNGASKDVIRLLLEAGCTPNTCNQHCSVLQCATCSPNSGLQEGVLKLLIKAGADLHHKSSICLAFTAGAGVNDIKLLMKDEIKLDSCSDHDSPWFCATNRMCGRLKTGVVELLIDAKYPVDVVNEHGWTPLKCALLDCDYNTRAIQLMMDHVDVSKDNTLLHAAVGNDHCKLDIVKLLIERGLKVDNLDSANETPLHRAVMSNCRNQLDIIDLLLRKGSPVNAVNMGGFTPLKKAVELDKDCDVLQVLLAVGAWVGDLLSYDCDFSPEVLKMLVKYSLVQNNELSMDMFIKDLKDCDEGVISYAKECELEVIKLGSKMIGHKYSLLDFVNDHSLQMPVVECIFEASHYDFNGLLRIMDNTDFPILFDVVSAKLGKITLEAKLQEHGVFTMKYYHFPNVAKKISLDSDSLSRIITYLSHADVLRMLIAYAC